MRGLFLFLALLFLIPFASADLASDTISYYAFDTGSGSVLVDSVGTQNGTISGATWTSSGIIDDALNFDGSNDNLVLGTASTSNPLKKVGDFSIDGWFNADTLTGGSVLNFDWSASNTNYIIDLQGTDLRMLSGSNSGTATITYNGGFSTGVWYYYAYVRDGNTLRMYVDGVEVDTVDITGKTGKLTTNNVYIGGLGSSFFDGRIDEVGYYNRALTPAEITFRYNLGAPTSAQQYPFSSGVSVPSADVRVQDLYDGANLQGINVTWANGKSNLTGFDGVAQCNNCSGQSFSVFDPNGLYFGSSGFAVENVTTTINVFGARINFSVFDVHNNSISSFTVSSGLQSNTSSGGFADLILAPDSSNVVLVESAGFISQNFVVNTSAQDLSSESLFGLFNNNMSITATDSVSGNPINNFCINVTGINTTSFSGSACTSSGVVSFGLLDEYYNFVIDAPDFALQNQTINVINESQSFEFLLLPTNSIFLFFFNELTQDSLNGVSVEVDFFAPDNSTFSNTTSSGELLVQDLAVGTWTLQASASGFTERNYFVSVGSRSSQLLDVFLAPLNQTEITTFAIRSKVNSDILVGAVVTMEHKVGNSWVVLDQCVSDAFGDCRFDLVDGVEYRFVVEADGFTTKTGTFVRTLSSYTISLSADSGVFKTYLDDFSFSSSPKGSLDGGVTDFILSVSSPDGRIEYFSQEIFYNNVSSVNNVTSSTSGGTITDSINLSGFTGDVLAVYTIKSTSFSDPFVFSERFFVFDSTPSNNLTFIAFTDYYGIGGDGELGVVTRGMLVTTTVVLLAAPVAFLFGSGAGVAVAVMVFGAAGLLGWLNWGLVVVVSALSLGLLFLGRGGGL